MLTVLLLAVALFFGDKTLAAPYVRCILALAILCSATHAVISPPPSFSAFFKYSNAFLSGAFVIRAVELLLVYDLPRLKRLGSVAASASPPKYVWKPLPTALGATRFLWICDLLVNPRAIGWNYGPVRYLPPLRDHRQSKKAFDDVNSIDQGAEVSPATFSKRQLRRIVFGYLILDAYQSTFGRNYLALCETLASAATAGWGSQISTEASEILVRKYLFGPVCWLTSYAFVDGVHALFGLVGVGALGSIAPKLSAEPWMYPPLFGPVQSLLTFRLRDIWGKFWHDLCRRPFLALSISLIPKSSPPYLKQLIVLYTSFTLSGVIHALGSYAVSRNLQAAGMMMFFFFVLPTCIALQQIISSELLPRLIPRNRASRAMILVLNAAFVWAWANLTCPWFIEYSMLPQSMASIPVPFSFWGWVCRSHTPDFALAGLR
ncbi:hypothetical protein P170DRAFT_438131 [Aspergillus steynii IBT 23096]|uniref:Wax synthase domain-containing protein n=1 Tax=Aspergillus steynii IBT 23096 TaxID=1392250 RepID=A0A2I2G6Q2_9EURO|nr:uncharacterized protein P170DRAFT_438131 [Aspergillus steynii IBT 23096]PLB48557.1 hypothetical protein P170DRAFT_438131 [Aspergillus steynii IBT 23096]